MKIKILLFFLFSLGLAFHSGLQAKFSQTTNYYLSINTPLLTKTEQHHLEQALRKLNEQDLEQAWNELAFVLHYFPNHPKALALLSDLSFKLAQPIRAKRYFERALSLYPDHAPTYALYGEFLMRDSKYSLAVAQFKKATILDKHTLVYQNQLNFAQKIR
jgi:Tfp pilus assembly protein PilF